MKRKYEVQGNEWEVSGEVSEGSSQKKYLGDVNLSKGILNYIQNDKQCMRS